MILGDGALTFREFAMREPLPLATIHDAVLEFLRGRDDAALYGALAVNAYVDEPRMTQDVDILSPRAKDLAEEIRVFLHDRFQIAVRTRRVKEGIGYRIYQARKPKNRHLVDLRSVESLPATQRVEDVLILAPADLIAAKSIALTQRRGKPKSGTDWRDLAMLLLAFPELKTDSGLVRERLEAAVAEGAAASVLDAWKDLVSQEILPADEDDGF